MSSHETEAAASAAPSTWIVSVEGTERPSRTKRVIYITVQAATPMDARNHVIAYATREVFEGRGCQVNNVWLYEYAPELAKRHAIDARRA